ncbi:agamous-like MADS-box protein AGL80 [Phoenix dactylifera]|uniref:Agamous-like MADS-box protein AGL80 n=1 Tax=Phoenix dactylifera TaxID=42345 RepID=A0A8B7CWB5_PHODC|nr:agamous-like MADS-box protein AGL80 [Phoenix dactylifera]
MARNKVKLAWIANDATRRATLKKRRKGLLKKVQELSILCGVEACAIVYGPNDRVPEVWPTPPEAARVIARFKSMPEMEQTRKMVNQEGFLRQRAMKLLEQLRKQERENREIEMKLLIREGLRGQSYDNLGIEEATCVSWMLERKIKEIYDKLDEISSKLAVKQAAAAAAPPPALPPQVMVPPPTAPPPPYPPVAPTGPVVPMEKTPVEQAMEALQRQNWFVDMMSPWPEDFYQASQPMDPYQPPPPASVDHTSPWTDPSFPFN